jgi:hypothetical protein
MSVDEYHTVAAYCLRQALADQNESDRLLWATLGRSWLQLAEDVTHGVLANVPAPSIEPPGSKTPHLHLVTS